jgi:LmbE family N-acetylglucosaminyl deacetylase
MFRDRIAVVAAHPDDEAIGLGGQLASMQDVFLIHVTDGAPRKRPDWKEYAATRRRELLAAAKIAGIPAERCLEAGFADQQAAHHLPEATEALASILTRIAPKIVFTHPYEGGHPDHDATAFAVHHAVTSAEIREFTSYHRHLNTGDVETGCFLQGDPGSVVQLSDNQRARKH